MSGANTKSVLARFCDNNLEKGKYFVKTFCVKKPVWEELGTSLALQCYAGFVSSGFPSKIAQEKRRQEETKVNCLLFSFLNFLSLPTQQDCVLPVN